MNKITQSFLVFITLCSSIYAQNEQKDEVSLKVLDPYKWGIIEIQSKNYRDVKKFASQLRKSSDKEKSHLGTALLARTARQMGRLSTAEKLLEPYKKLPLSFEAGNKNLCYLEVAKLLTHEKQYSNALQYLHFLGRNQEGWPRVDCSEEMSDVFFVKASFYKALEWIEFAITDFKKNVFSKTDPVLVKHLKHLEEKRGKIKHIINVIELGLGYILYQEADKLYFDKKYNLAEKKFKSLLYKYEQNKNNADLDLSTIEEDGKFDESLLSKLPISPMYSEASKFKLLLCKLKTENIKEVYPEIKAFIDEDPYGLYRGEISYLLGNYLLEEQLQAEKAIQYLSNAVTWVEEVRKDDKKTEDMSPPTKSTSKVSPPPSMHKTDKWGNVSWSLPDAGKLFNRTTSDWYLNNLRFNAQSKRGLCHYILGNKEEALKDIKVILEESEIEAKLYRSNRPSSYGRLKAEFEKDRMFATAIELKQFRGELRTGVIIADYYMEIEQWGNAEKRYRNLLKNDSLSQNEEAYIKYALSQCIGILKKKDEALNLLEEVNSKYKRSPTWQRSMISAYQYYQSNKKTHRKAEETLLETYKRNPRTKEGQYAFYHLGEFYFAYGKFDEAEKSFLSSAKKFKGTWMAKGAENYLKKIEIVKKTKAKTWYEATVKAKEMGLEI